MQIECVVSQRTYDRKYGTGINPDKGWSGSSLDRGWSALFLPTEK